MFLCNTGRQNPVGHAVQSDVGVDNRTVSLSKGCLAGKCVAMEQWIADKCFCGGVLRCVNAAMVF